MTKLVFYSLAVFVVAGVISPGVKAAAVTTAPVMGRAPVANKLLVINKTKADLTPRVGHILEASYAFSDVDGDTEDGTSFRWLRGGGVIAGATAKTYLTVAADANKQLSFEVSPRTSSTSTDPSIGKYEVSFPELVVPSDKIFDVGSFLAPDRVMRNANQIRDYCDSRNARVPDFWELDSLFKSFTTTGGEMCSLYGWPLSGQCGGSQDHYWSSSFFDNALQGMNLANGSRVGIQSVPSSVVAYAYVACIR